MLGSFDSSSIDCMRLLLTVKSTRLQPFVLRVISGARNNEVAFRSKREKRGREACFRSKRMHPGRLSSGCRSKRPLVMLAAVNWRNDWTVPLAQDSRPIVAVQFTRLYA
jgi:hypothetical protein